MPNFTNTFGGSAISPADVAYAAYSYSANLTLFWPSFSAGQPNVVARFMNLTPTATALNVYLPAATLSSTGFDTVIFNAGVYNINIVSNTGAAIATIAPGQTYYILLTDNTTISGLWQTVQFGVGTGAANAAALAGQGLLANAGVLNVNFTAALSSSSFTITTANRAQLQVWTGGTGMITLPAASAVGNGFFFPLANNGSGTLTVTPNGGDLIDGAASSVFAQTQSGFLVSNGINWYTIGKSTGGTASVSLLNLNVGGSSNITETSAQAVNTIQQFTGTLTGNINVIVPATVQLYYIFNNTSGAYTLTFKTAAGTGLAIPQGTHVILYCDGTNVINGYTASVSTTISLSPGSANSPNFNFVGAANTGIYSPSTGQIAVTAGGFEVMNFISAASSVNYFQTAASATTTPLSITAMGSDGDIGINYVAKGAGSHNFLGNGGATQFYIGNVAAAVNQLNVSGAATTVSPTLAVSGADTNIGINYTAKGVGVHTFNNSIVGNLTGNITGTAPAGTLTGTVLNPTVVTSSLTTVGTITTGVWNGSIINTTYGGTPIYVATGSATGTANAIIVAATLPSSFTFSAGKIITVFPSATNTGAVTLAANGTAAAPVYKASPTGLIACSGGEFVNGINAYVFCDGTQYQLLNPNSPNFGIVKSTSVSVSGGITASNIDGAIIGAITRAAGHFTTVDATGAFSTFNTVAGGGATMFSGVNQSSTAGTSAVFALQPSTTGGKAVIINAINDGSDNIELLFYTSTTANTQFYRGGFQAAGGFLVGSSNNRPSGTCNDGDVNIAGSYRVNGVPLTGSNLQIFTSSGTWTKPASGTMVHIQIWGGGGSGASAGFGYTGGGGGSYTESWMPLSSLPSSVSVIVGAGGTSTSGDGNPGGASSFGSYGTAYGGTGGHGVSGGGTGGAGGGVRSTAAVTANNDTISWFGINLGAPGGAAIATSTANGNGGLWTGGGGGNNNSLGGNAIYGGSGGSGNNISTSATSLYGGIGGWFTNTSSYSLATSPGGGGPASVSGIYNSGARGEVRITVF